MTDCHEFSGLYLKYNATSGTSGCRPAGRPGILCASARLRQASSVMLDTPRALTADERRALNLLSRPQFP